MSMTKIRVALDWTPNTIHSGFYVALDAGYYTELGLDVELISPGPDYSVTPVKQIVAGGAELAICPSESVIAYAENSRVERKSFRIQAIYAILQKDASAIVSLRNNEKVNRPRDLENGVYGSYNARYEDNIVRTMVTNDGGDSNKMLIEKSKGKLSLFDEVKADNIDATWVFLPWEGVEAESGIEKAKLDTFRMEDYGVPYGYSPVIVRNASAQSSLSDSIISQFIHATRKGYRLARESPEHAVRVLQPHCVPERSETMLHVSQQDINNLYMSDGESKLGEMKLEKWQAWVDWLKGQRLVNMADWKVEELFKNF